MALFILIGRRLGVCPTDHVRRDAHRGRVLDSLPDDLSPLSLRELFNQVFPSDPSLQQPLLQRLDVNGNPDLPDMYDDLVEIFIREELGLCTVDTYVNHGLKLDDSATIGQQLTTNDTPPVLDLVLEQRFSAIDYAVRRGDFADQEQALGWMCSRALLYFIGALDYVLPTEPVDDADTALLPIAQSLVEKGVIQRPADSGPFEITELGMEAIHEMTAEAENVIERYEVFGDVLYDPETGECDFDTGVGIDLRIPVYEAEALSAVRAVLYVELCDGEFARMDDDWRVEIHDREFFEACSCRWSSARSSTRRTSTPSSTPGSRSWRIRPAKLPSWTRTRG